MYLVFARKYRPQRFEEVVGQQHIARALQNAVKGDRVAHAYLFCGSRGVGKTTVARLLAKALDCEKGPTPEPCCQCEPCRRIAAGEFIDVLEIDGASNRGIDQIRELRQNVQYSPARSHYKIYYIDEVHMLTGEAFNALLKTLEEPPGHVKFIFSTTDPQQMPETIKSRCQRFDFHRISDADIVAHLQDICGREKIEPDAAALQIIARAARGSMRDALSIADQVISFGEGALRAEEVIEVLGVVECRVLCEMVDALADEDTARALRILHESLFKGTDVLDFCDQFSEYLRDLMVASYCGPEDPILAGAAADAETLERQSARFSPDQLCYMIQLVREAKLRARRDTTGRLALELAVMKMSRLSDLVNLEEALADATPERATDGGEPAQEQPRANLRVSGVLRNMKQKLANPDRARTDKPAPGSLEKTRFPKIQNAAENPAVAEAAREDQLLIKTFEEGDKAIGLHPVRLSRNTSAQEPDPGSEEQESDDQQ